MANSNKMIAHFEEKPQTQQYFEEIDRLVNSLGTIEREIKAQVSYKVKRKFLWLWTYQKTADGTLYLTVLLDRRVTCSKLHGVSQVSKNRWNHHVVVKTIDTVQSGWFYYLLKQGYLFSK